MSKKFLFSIVCTAIFIATAVPLEAWGKIPFPFLEISFAFVPMLFCGMLFGPFWGAVCAILTDFLATTVAGQGAYFPGLIPAVALTGLFFGLLGIINKKCKSDKLFYPFAAFIVLCNALLCEALLKSLGIVAFQIMVLQKYDQFSWALLGGVLPVRMVFAIIQAVVIFALTVMARKQILPRINKITRNYHI